jgi:acyl carrier protein
MSDTSVDVEQVCRLYERALGIDAVEPDNDLFELGGHSLTAAQILAEVEEKFGVRVPLAIFLDEPTPQALCRMAARVAQDAR